jgi:hypothetical protein
MSNACSQIFAGRDDFRIFKWNIAEKFVFQELRYKNRNDERE